MASGQVIISVECLGTYTGEVVKVFDDGRVSVQLDDGSVEFAGTMACGADDELFEGQQICAARMKVGGGEPCLMVFGFVESGESE